MIDRIKKLKLKSVPLANEFATGITIRKLILGKSICKMSNGWYIFAFNFYVAFLAVSFCFLPSSVFAIVDPLATPNNKVGIHIISATPDEIGPAQDLVNSFGGDWGYVTILIESRDRKVDKWQTVFNDLRRRHLIPLVRIATEPQGNFWKVPSEGEEEKWADFLDQLPWPIKNRYIIVYNEPNQGQEWAGKVDPKSYVRVLDKTITALKNKNPDFFVMNAGFDASAPNQQPLYLDEANYLKQMDEEIPGIFNKLDGWSSHSYPNPGFAGSPYATGKGTIKTYLWEKEFLKSLGVNKNLPIFITETGWKHAEGINFDKSLPTAETVGKHLEYAFLNVWNDSQIVAVTPFLLSYQAPPFDHFSFKRLTGEKQNTKILGATYPEYYPHYQSMVNIPKVSGEPIQNKLSKLVSGALYSSIVVNEEYALTLVFENMGQSIWNDKGAISLKAFSGEKELGLKVVSSATEKIEPKQTAQFKIAMNAPEKGSYKAALQLFQGNKPFDQDPLEFDVEVKSPVILIPKALLKWKDDFSGEYFLTVKSDFLTTTEKIAFNKAGIGEPLKAHFLLPDYTFKFTLQRKFYKPKTLDFTTLSGTNTLDFGLMQPDFMAALIKPVELWKLLPFSRSAP